MYRISIVGKIGGQRFMNSIHYVFSEQDPFSTNDEKDFLDAFWSHLGGEYRSLVGTDGVVEEIWLSTLPAPNTQDAGQRYTKVVNATGTMSITLGTPLPNELHGVLALKTEFAARWARGYQVLPPLRRSTYVDGENVNTGGAYYLAMGPYATKLAGTFETATSWYDTITGTYRAQPVIYSRTRRARNQEPYIASINAVQVRPAVYYRRSRGRGA